MNVFVFISDKKQEERRVLTPASLSSHPEGCELRVPRGAETYDMDAGINIDPPPEGSALSHEYDALHFSSQDCIILVLYRHRYSNCLCVHKGEGARDGIGKTKESQIYSTKYNVLCKVNGHLGDSETFTLY